MNHIPVIVGFSQRRRSTGRIRGGKIVLDLPRGLPTRVRDEHIDYLAGVLTKRAEALRGVPMPTGAGAVPVTTLNELRDLAHSLNVQYFGFEYDRVGWRRQETRWGSCSVRLRRIHVSHRLKGAPVGLVAYVLIHELCHLREANHGKAFWALVAGACPDYRLRRRQLEAWELIRPTE